MWFFWLLFWIFAVMALGQLWLGIKDYIIISIPLALIGAIYWVGIIKPLFFN